MAAGRKQQGGPYVWVRPRAPLSRFVERLWWLDLRGRDLRVREHIVPDVTADACWSLGSGYLRQGQPVARDTFEGFGLEPRRFDHVPGNWLVGVRFRPAGVRAFTGPMPVSALGVHAPLDAWLGQDADRLAEQLAEAGTSDGAWALVESLLMRRLAPPGAAHALVESALVALRDEPCLRMRALAARLGASERTLLRAFREHTGATPKHVQRVVRVRRALQRLEVGGSRAGIAAELGFYDQSHMRHELRSLAGGTESHAEVAVFSKTAGAG